jgi:hypothetical protein
MDFIYKFFSIYFNSNTPLEAFLEGVVFIIGVYGIFSILLFLLRYYIIYTLSKKISKLWKQIKFKDKPYVPPSNKEDERLRDEEKEREVEKIEVEKIESNKREKEEPDFKIMLPKAIGKWTKLIIGNRENMIIAIAQKMQANNSSNFWQNYVDVQKEQMGKQNGQRRG